jgi:hypothetical protein
MKDLPTDDIRIDGAYIFAGITAPMWVTQLESWFSAIAAFLAIILLIIRIYKSIKTDKDID